MSILEAHIENLESQLISTDPITEDLWKKDLVTKNQVIMLTIRRLDITERITQVSHRDSSELAELNRGIGMLQVIDDLLNYTFLDDMKDLLREED